jgi:hypothetical protein
MPGIWEDVPLFRAVLLVGKVLFRLQKMSELILVDEHGECEGDGCSRCQTTWTTPTIHHCNRRSRAVSPSSITCLGLALHSSGFMSSNDTGPVYPISLNFCTVDLR